MANGLFNLKQVMQGIQQGGWNGQKPPAVEYLVVAGGGGGGAYYGAGGGAGGLLQGIDPVPNSQTLLVTVGGGGTGASGGGTGTNGSASVFGQISSAGGGGGAGGSASSVKNGLAGGSGGGGQNYDAGNGVASGGAAVLGQGNAGGPGVGGGGGGAGTKGYRPAAINAAGGGGAGIASVISGTVTAYAGGGAGAGGSLPGGVGGGGAANVAGTANTGGGGGGDSGSNGGSGIVIVSYPDIYAAAASSTNATVSTSGSGSLLINTTSYVKYPNNAAFTLSGDFTIEGFFYPTNISAGPYFWSLGDDATSAGICLYYSVGSSALRVYTNGAAPLTGTNISNNTWYHFSLVRSGGGTNNVVLYVNGTSVGSITNTATFNSVSGNGFAVGAEYSGGAFGASSSFYASNIRVVKGTAIVPPAGGPTAPLTPVTNTSFLMNTVSGAYLADSSSSSLTATVVNTSAWNQLSPFTTTGYKNRVYTWTTSGSITF